VYIQVPFLKDRDRGTIWPETEWHPFTVADQAANTLELMIDVHGLEDRKNEKTWTRLLFEHIEDLKSGKLAEFDKSARTPTHVLRERTCRVSHVGASASSWRRAGAARPTIRRPADGVCGGASRVVSYRARSRADGGRRPQGVDGGARRGREEADGRPRGQPAPGPPTQPDN
jgi:hypothetical protein